MHCAANHNKHSQKPIGTSLIAPPPAATIGNACGRVSAHHIEENWLFAQSLYLLAAGDFFFFGAGGALRSQTDTQRA